MVGLLPLPLHQRHHHHLLLPGRPNMLLPLGKQISSSTSCLSKPKPPFTLAVQRVTDKKDEDEHGHPDEYYDDVRPFLYRYTILSVCKQIECGIFQSKIGSQVCSGLLGFIPMEWQAQQREKTKEWHAYRQKEEDMENMKMNEYREIGMRLKGYSEEEVRNARILVSSFIRSAEEVEEKIEEAGEKGELTELVLMVILNRLDLARHDEEKDAIRSLDLLYRRVETEILKRESSPSMILLNELLNLHDGFDDEGWKKKCRKIMIDTFPREDPFSILVPAGFDIDTHEGHIELPEDDDILLRVDFVREIDSLLKEVKAEQSNVQTPQGFDPESVANRLKQQEKQRTIHQVEALMELAVDLQW